MKKVHRNDRCPCGKTKIIVFTGTDFPDKEVPVKYKHCHLNEMGPQTGAIRSTKEIIDARNVKRVKLGLLKPLN